MGFCSDLVQKSESIWKSFKALHNMVLAVFGTQGQQHGKFACDALESEKADDKRGEPSNFRRTAIVGLGAAEGSLLKSGDGGQ